MKTRLLIFLCLFGVFTVNAQIPDSLGLKRNGESETNGHHPEGLKAKVETGLTVGASKELAGKQYNLNYAHHSFSAALPLAAVGLALMPVDGYVSSSVQTNMPGFELKFDDYLQYAPWATHLTMGLCGVKGVSRNRYQIVTADAFAAIMMAAVVNGLKYSINRTRPNGHDASFPSGHTATAFTGATLLAHEYGDRSIWIPIAGYTVATATGVMRVLNNRHYVSDVIVGAAVGILTAELAYWVTDAIFNDWKLFKSHRNMSVDYIINNY